MQLIKALNLALAFLLELALFAALGIWASALLPDSPWRFALAFGAIAAAVLMWGRWAAPRSAYRLRMPWLYAFKIALFALAALALVAAAQPGWAAALAMLSGLNLWLAVVWRQEPSGPQISGR